MTDLEMLLLALVTLLAFLAGWISGRVGMIDPTIGRPEGDEPLLPIHLRRVDARRRAGKRRWTS